MYGVIQIKIGSSVKVKFPFHPISKQVMAERKSWKGYL